MMHLAIFDFDGTMTRKDSLFDFIAYAVGKIKFWFGFAILLPWLILFKLGLISNTKTKEIVLAYFFHGWEEGRFKNTARQYARQQLPSIINASTLAKVDWHKRQGHKVVVLTASPEDYLQDWCAQNNLELIATHLEYKGGRVTGKLSGKNCHGPEKICRLKEAYDLKKFQYIYAYGDSPGDLALQEIANEFYYKDFNWRLKRFEVES